MACGLGQERGAAMAADVVECAHLAVVVANGEDRIAGDRAGDVVAWVRQRSDQENSIQLRAKISLRSRSYISGSR